MSRRYVMIFVLVALALVAARALVQATDGAAEEANAGAAWIGAAPEGEHGAPSAVFLAQDFELDFKPRRAELTIAGDEEYQLLINGKGVAAGRYRDQLDAYPVGARLRRGSNRIVVELRSSRGVSGLLLRLRIEGRDGRTATVVSDESWRVVRRFVPGLSRPSTEIAGEPVRVWGTPPTGRWPVMVSVRQALTLRRLQGGRERFPRAARRVHRLGERWTTVRSLDGAALGPWVTFDFLRQQTGFVQLLFNDAQASNAFLYYSNRRPRDGIDNPDEIVIRPPGRGFWVPAVPAEFRYVTVVGAPQLRAAEVLRVEVAIEAEARQPVAPLLGVDRRLTLVSPVEDEVRRKLEGVASIARREEG